MESIGLRALRQQASDVVRRVEGGEAIDITVSGRVVARIVPVEPKRWHGWDDIADLFVYGVDEGWRADVDMFDQTVSDPWERNR